MADYYLGQGDLDPILEAVAVIGGKIYDLTGASLAMFIAPFGSELLANGQTVVVADGPAAIIQYAWVSSDSTTPGTFNFQVRGTLADGRPITFPNDRYLSLEVQAKL